MSGFWTGGDSPEERRARDEAYRRLAEAGRRVGLSLERLRDLMGQVARNEEETRRFLSENVYGVPDDLLDDLLRIRLSELEDGGAS